jgi:cell wall-associated NlpC family hydrolase
MLKFFWATVLLCLLITCKKPDIDPTLTENLVVSELTHEQDQLLASIPDTSFTPADIVFYDGETLEEFLTATEPSALIGWGNRQTEAQRIQGENDSYKKYLNRLYDQATFLTNTSAHHFPANDAGPGPEQWGIAYAHSGKDYRVRTKNGDCSEMLHGLDCSGFVGLVLKSAGVIIPPATGDRKGTEMIADEQVVNAALHAVPEYSGMKYEYREIKNISEIDDGDLIIFYNTVTITDKKGNVTGTKRGVSHAGIALTTPTSTAPFSSLFIYQSNGRKEKSAPVKKNNVVLRNWNNTGDSMSRGCEQYSNADRRGPRCVPALRFLKTPDFSDYTVMKLIKPTDVTDPPPPPSEETIRIVMADGNDQFADIDKPLKNELAVKVIGTRGEPLKNISVQFKADHSGDVLSANYVQTNSAGVASVKCTLKDFPGTHSIVASIKDENNITKSQVFRVRTNEFLLQKPEIFRDSTRVPGNVFPGYYILYHLKFRCDFVTPVTNWDMTKQQPRGVKNGVTHEDPIVIYHQTKKDGTVQSWYNPPGGWSTSDNSNKGPLVTYSIPTIVDGLVKTTATFWIRNAFEYEVEEQKNWPGKYNCRFHLGKWENNFTSEYAASNEITIEYK